MADNSVANTKQIDNTPRTPDINHDEPANLKPSNTVAEPSAVETIVAVEAAEEPTSLPNIIETDLDINNPLANDTVEILTDTENNIFAEQLLVPTVNDSIPEVENDNVAIVDEAEVTKEIEQQLFTGKVGGDEMDNNLIDIINSMEADRQKFIAHVRTKISNQESEFEKTKSENARLKKRVAELEACLRQNNVNFAAAVLPTGKSKKAQKNEDDDLLTKAKALLFEKTKICKQQEQQLVALKAQVDAVKEVLTVTKEMLCLRNIEHDHSEARMETIGLKLKNERARLGLCDKKLEISKKMYTDLKTEYDVQSKIFKQLRAGYEEKIMALNKQITALKS